VRVVGELNHFFKPAVVNLSDDDGDDNSNIDCWESKDPSMVKQWTLLWAPHSDHLVFGCTYTGEVSEAQHIDFECKVTDVSHESNEIVKVSCSSSSDDPYMFSVVIDTVQSPFDIVECIYSLHASKFDAIVQQLETELCQKKWETKDGLPLKAKGVAQRLRKLLGQMSTFAAIESTKVTTRARPVELSGTTQVGSQEPSQASAPTRTPRARTSRSNLQAPAPASLVKKRAPSKTTESASKKKSKLLTEEDVSNSIASALSELPQAIGAADPVDYNNVQHIYQKFWTDCQDAFIFDDPEKKTELDVQKLKNAPEEWTIRAFEKRGMEELLKYYMWMPNKSLKQTLCVMPMTEFKPQSLSDIPDDCEYWIINGQHSVAASMAMINGNVPEPIRKNFRTWNCFLVWTQDHEKLRKISAYYNRVNHLVMFKSTWANNLLGSRSVWISHGRPQPKFNATGVRGSRKQGRRTPAEVVNDKMYEVSNIYSWTHSLARLELNCGIQLLHFIAPSSTISVELQHILLMLMTTTLCAEVHDCNAGEVRHDRRRKESSRAPKVGKE
jgi:hypothetical protein